MKARMMFSETDLTLLAISPNAEVDHIEFNGVQSVDDNNALEQVQYTDDPVVYYSAWAHVVGRGAVCVADFYLPESIAYNAALALAESCELDFHDNRPTKTYEEANNASNN